MSRKQTLIALCAAALAVIVVTGYFVLPRSSA
jgi:hypothetical protein